MKSIQVSVLLVLAAGMAGPARGQVSWGQPSQVNTYTTGYQRLPAVAVAPDGHFLVVWQSAGSAGGDTEGTSVQGRWFGADGVPRGEDFQVNTVTTYDQGAPEVALTASGGAVVAWRTHLPVGPPAGTYTLSQQRYSPEGMALGAEVVVDSDVSVYEYEYSVSGDFSDLAVATGPDGGFMVAWLQTVTSSGMSSGCWPSSCVSTRIRRSSFAADGTPLGGPVTEDSGWTGWDCDYGCSGVTSPALGSIPGGGFVLAWFEDRWDSWGHTTSRIAGQRLDSQGLPVGGSFEVTDGDPYPEVALPGSITPAPNGGFLVAWGGGIGDVSGVRARAFAADATPLGPSGGLVAPAARPAWPVGEADPWEPEAGFRALWYSYPDYDETIRGQSFDWQWSPVGAQAVPSSTQQIERDPPDLSGDVAVWTSWDSAGSDQSFTSIQARRLPPVSFGLGGWWRGEGDATDSSWLGNDGALAGGAGFAPGVIGSAFALDGVDDSVAVPDRDSLDMGVGDLSITYWVKTTDTWPVILDKRSVSPSAGYMAFLENGSPGLKLKDASGSTNYVCSAVVSDDLFHFVAISVDRDSPTGGRIWVDGQLALEFDPTGRPGSLANAQELRIGAQGEPFGGGANLGGLLDEVRLYDRALTEAGMRYLYESGRSLLFQDGFESGDTLGWSFTAP